METKTGLGITVDRSGQGVPAPVKIGGFFSFMKRFDDRGNTAKCVVIPSSPGAVSGLHVKIAVLNSKVVKGRKLFSI